ncbi:MerR family transcriptional regulator [Parapedobacter soli]|uniref:MerR family transcriptional regulator n=1 Tax=Parapedobacter soli TaxID=416955 RepID=UPI0021C57C65|nr:MerR family transcriptional regulator [Parapedobacter soli]
MKTLTVKKLAEISGVSVRTLHYYDQIGLLRPSIRTEKKYRLYGNDELLRLQQILFFREMDFPLKDILEMMDTTDYDLVKALMQHKSALLNRKRRISDLLKTIDTTIDNLKKGETMKNPEELYKGFPEEVGTTYRKEAISKYGVQTVEQSEKELMKLGKSGVEALQKEMENVFSELFVLKNDNPESDIVQEHIARHYGIISKFWGDSVVSDQKPDAYAGLGDLFVNDERYLANVTDGSPQPEFALFLQKAIKYFAENNLEK